MKNLFRNATFITILMIVFSFGVAYSLDSFTDKYIPQGNDSNVSKPDDTNKADTPDTPNKEPDSNDNNTEDTFNPIKPSNGGIKGGNEAAVKNGRLPGSDNKPINQNPEIFAYRINKNLSFKKPDAVGTIMAENDPGNTDSMQLCIYIGEEQKLIYASAMIRPNQYVNGDKLFVKLKKGEYPATAVISVYNTDTGELKTSIYEEIKVRVDDSWFNLFG